ncbi:MAG: hypothetical protein MSIBF_00650 [Candidatus Altiarchaeales archaeon IMC4]|nr:MAG: hypothetical protein MSIBF_00650 [Candidatus Altiarchaeales archaeon IMC4]
MALKETKVVRDPIHGNITLTDLEVAVLDTPQVQRLRNIKQNGFCYLVYPAMNSTRFEHSLGVMHLAGRVADQLGVHYDDWEMLRVAGLLHDVGHYPFSHTLDELIAKFGVPHEERSSELIKTTELSDILKAHGMNPSVIAEMVMGRGNLGKVISSEIDVDRMDYLIRDSYYAGVAYGVIDLDRIISSIKLVGREIVVDRRGLEAAESLLINRNMMYQTVYRHHTKRIAEAMFRRAIQSAFEEGMRHDSILKMDDIDLVHSLRNSGTYSRGIMGRIDRRLLFKRFFKENVSLLLESFREDAKKRQVEIDNKIADDIGVERGSVLIDMPKTKMSEFRILVDCEGEMRRIDEVSSLAKALERSESDKLIFYVYVDPKYLDKTKGFDAEKYIQYSQTMLKKFY